MFLRVRPPGRFEDLVRLGVGLGEAGVLLVVVVQVEAELVRDLLQPGSEIIDVRETPELDRDRLRRDGNVLRGHDRLRRVVVVGVGVGVVRPLVLRLGRDDVAVAVMVHDHPVAVRVDQDVVVMPRRGAVMVMLRERGTPAEQGCRNENTPDGIHDHILREGERGRSVRERRSRSAVEAAGGRGVDTQPGLRLRSLHAALSSPDEHSRG